MKVFLSHIHEEAPLANVLKSWVESSFSGQCSVFVSSDIDDIPAGNEWRKQIKNSLKDTSVFIALCSPQSMYRPWIQFETGCAWVLDVPVLPICHSGVIDKDLPATMSNFQSIVVEANSFTTDLLKSLAKHFDFPKIPNIDESTFLEDISFAKSKIEYQSIGTQRQSTENQTKSNIDEEEAEILVAISESAGGMTVEEIANRFDISWTKAQYFMDDLIEKHLLEYSGTLLGLPTYYYISKEGRKFMYEANLI